MGSYRATKNSRMSDYAMTIAKHAKYLEPPMSESGTIRILKRHFDKDVAREIRPSTVKNMKDLVAILDEVEEEKALRAERRQPNKFREDEAKPANMTDNTPRGKLRHDERDHVRRGNYTNEPQRRYQAEYKPRGRAEDLPRVKEEVPPRGSGNLIENLTSRRRIIGDRFQKPRKKTRMLQSLGGKWQ